MSSAGRGADATTAAEYAAVINRDWKAFGEAIRISGITPEQDPHPH